MRRSIPTLVLAAATLVAVVPALAAFGGSALARPRKPRVRYEDVSTKRPSARYAAMGKKVCVTELRRRKIQFTAVRAARGVLAPVRLAGDVGGVTFRTEAPSAERATSPGEVMDCRLVLALHDWSGALVKRGIDEVRTVSAWRPPPTSWPRGKLGSRHGGGLAVDVKQFGKKLADGETSRRWLRVESDFHGRIGEQVCGKTDSGRKLPGAAADLRAIVCEADRLRIFTSILTPAYDRAHRDHLHVEIRPGAGWSLLL